MADKADNPPSIEPHLAAAYQLESDGELERAVAECRQALTVRPDSAEAYNLLGIIIEQNGQQAEAIEAFRTAMELDPDFQDARENFKAALAEANASRQARPGKDVWRSALLGAAIFGLAFSVVGGSIAASSVRLLPNGAYDTNTINLPVFYSLSALATGASAVLLEIASRRSRHLIGYFIAGVVGGLCGHLASDFVRSVLNITLEQWPYLQIYVEGALRQAAFGVCVGAALGAIVPGRNFTKLMLAGALGFAIADPIGSWAAQAFQVAFVAFNPAGFDPLGLVTLLFMSQIVAGVVGGASLGWAIGSAHATASGDQSTAARAPVPAALAEPAQPAGGENRGQPAAPDQTRTDPAGQRQRTGLKVAGVLLALFAIGGGIFSAPYIIVQTTQQSHLISMVDTFMHAMTNHNVAQAYSLFSTRAQQATPISALQGLQDYQSGALFEKYQSINVTHWRDGWSFFGGATSPFGITADIAGDILYTNGKKRSFSADFELENFQWGLDSIHFGGTLSDGVSPTGAIWRAEPFLAKFRPQG
jgi:hypothetical protein